MGDLLDGYDSPAWDEMFDAPGVPRPSYRVLNDGLQTLSGEDFDRRCSVRDRVFRDQGITFSLSGEERPFPLDLVPRVLSAQEWSVVEQGVFQRVLALEAFLADVYGPAHILRDGVVPTGAVTSSANFHRPAAGVEPANGVRVVVAGIDLVRDVNGQFLVLEDNLRTPSGISYVIENRRTMARVFPELFASYRVRPADGYPARLLEALSAAAPASVSEPTVVVLTPGMHNSAYFEHHHRSRRPRQRGPPHPRPGALRPGVHRHVGADGRPSGTVALAAVGLRRGRRRRGRPVLPPDGGRELAARRFASAVRSRSLMREHSR